MSSRIDLLTEREKEVLRLVHALKTTAEIAHLLGLAEVSVNKRIDSARNKLGGISRRQAALLLAESEGAKGYENLIPPEIILTDPAPEPPSDDPKGASWDETEKDGGTGTSPPGERRNALDLWQRVGAILLAMAVFAGAASAYILALERISRN